MKVALFHDLHKKLQISTVSEMYVLVSLRIAIDYSDIAYGWKSALVQNYTDNGVPDDSVSWTPIFSQNSWFLQQEIYMWPDELSSKQ